MFAQRRFAAFSTVVTPADALRRLCGLDSCLGQAILWEMRLSTEHRGITACAYHWLYWSWVQTHTCIRDVPLWALSLAWREGDGGAHDSVAAVLPDYLPTYPKARIYRHPHPLSRWWSACARHVPEVAAGSGQQGNQYGAYLKRAHGSGRSVPFVGVRRSHRHRLTMDRGRQKTGMPRGSP